MVEIQVLGGKVDQDGFPPEVLAEATALLRETEWIVPTWCQRIVFAWDYKQPDDGTLVTTMTCYGYRWARLTFYPAWMHETDDDKRLHMIHELLHVSTGVVTSWVENIIRMLLPEDNTQRQILTAERCERTESMVCDLALLIARKLGG